MLNNERLNLLQLATALKYLINSFFKHDVAHFCMHNKLKVYDRHTNLSPFFPSMIFCGEAAKKTSIDGLKWRDLVMGGGANGEMANLTNEKGKFAIAIFRHYSPFFAIGSF